MGSDEGHFNVSLIVRDTVTNEKVSTNLNLFEEKGELKRNRNEALLLSRLTHYHWAKPAHHRRQDISLYLCRFLHQM